MAQVRVYMVEVIEALRHLHSMQIMHRDIKLENIQYGRSHIVLIDFGIATSFGTHQRLTEVCGTPGYMAPGDYNSLSFYTHI